ncbi:MAG: hypothetical protein CVU89_13120 [Firmicutes bacterium HGW-Firmicutes-14]|nr:MAG: hypothetical protein CVU89_13120 [Firmicutes bacterium HGW-Firmicutes-14]
MNKIDVLIPVVEKDREVLPYAIDFARKNIRHPIGEVFIIAPDDGIFKTMSAQKGCRFINENTVLPITRKDIDYCPKIKNKFLDRSGWLFQQLLKLSGDKIGSQEGYLVLDADTLLIRPHVFEHNGKTVFFYRKDLHRPYLQTYEKLLGEKAMAADSSISFVIQYMYFKNNKLAELKKLIEARHHTDWYTAIINNINKQELSSFSEFETYGNYIFKNYPRQMILRTRQNLCLRRRVLKNLSKINIPELAGKCRSISFHAYYQ